jgi:hypothetical protein
MATSIAISAGSWNASRGGAVVSDFDDAVRALRTAPVLRDVLAFVRAYYEQWGRWPTVEQIVDHIGL